VLIADTVTLQFGWRQRRARLVKSACQFNVSSLNRAGVSSVWGNTEGVRKNFGNLERPDAGCRSELYPDQLSDLFPELAQPVTSARVDTKKLVLLGV